jgi:hypothetical protein
MNVLIIIVWIKVIKSFESLPERILAPFLWRELIPIFCIRVKLKNSCKHFKDKISLHFGVIGACNFRLLPVVTKGASFGSVPAQPELKKSEGNFFKEAKAAPL